MQLEFNKLNKISDNYRDVMEDKLRANTDIVNTAISKYLELGDKDYDVLFESMRYSSLAGGKRIRAYLTMQFFELFGANESGNERVLPLAAAVEMIHTYSLIHDDLPCMDDDDMRRGKPSNHKKYGEAAALLAGDALLTYAFNITANAPLLSPEEKVRVIEEMSYAAGHNGMIGGQMIDINMSGEEAEDISCSDNVSNIIKRIKLIKLHTLKTGHMIMMAARVGCIVGGAEEEEIDIAMGYAKNIGLAFQVIDDILDKTGDAALLGKNTGSDDKNAKITFLGVLSEIDAYTYAKSVTLEALAALEKLCEMIKIKRNGKINDGAAENLVMLAKYLLERKA